MSLDVDAALRAEPAGLVKMVVFRLGAEEFSAPIESVSEILRPTKLTRMPRAPQWVMGVMNLRGRVFPVVDLKLRLGLAPSTVDPRSRYMVVEAAGDQMGLLVDEVKEVLRVAPESFEATPELARPSTREYLSGVVTVGEPNTAGERMILVLDLEKLFAHESAPASAGQAQ